MISLEEPISRVLRDFCHAEWYEVDELVELVNDGTAKFDVSELRKQFEALLSGSNGIAAPINNLTANEFDSDAEACAWLEGIFRKVFE